MYRLTLSIAVLFLLQACSTYWPDPGSGIKPDTGVLAQEEIRKSPNDDREYRYLRLDNELQVVLISDPKADKSAASLSAFRGNYSDPDRYPGLAHFLEHMLFIGTEKYPEPDGYFQFVQSHGGSSNAYTSTDHTNYFFDIQPDYFREGFDRFAQFFISPSFDPTYVDREKNAVDSEYKLRIKEDSWRGFMAFKVTVNPEHPFGKFNIGTLESLDETVHGALLEFFEQEYSANQMALVVLDNQSLDEMQSWITPIVREIRNNNVDPFTVDVPLFKKGQLPGILTHQTLQQNYTVSFNFPVPQLDQHYLKKPGDYLSNLLGHEGEGSLHSALVKNGWITSLGSGDQSMDDKTSMLAINISLTPQGREHIPEIADLFFDYVNLLKSQDPEAWRYQEQATVAELGFRFQDEAPAQATVSNLSPMLAHIPARDLLTHSYLMEEFDPDLIKSYLDYLTPDNVMMEISGPDVETTEIEKWFQVGYTLKKEPIPMSDITDGSLMLPAPNVFLPEDLEIGENDSVGPQKVVDTQSTEIWIDVDNEFSVPRATYNISLRPVDGLITLEDHVLAGLYRRIVADDLNTLSYPALLAGVAYQLAAPPRGFRITTTGYSDKQLVLMDSVLDSFADLHIDPERFEVLKADSLRAMRNAKSELPFRQTQSAMSNLLLSSSWSPEQQADYLQDVSLAQLESWRAKKLKAVDVLAMVHGNVSRDNVDGLQKVLGKHLVLADIASVRPTVAEADEALLHEMEIDHNDASMTLHVQDADESFTSRARSALLTQLLRSAFFSSLRTEQQLGYVVGVSSAPIYYRGGVTFIIQSPVAGPGTLEEKTIEFIDTQLKVLASLDGTMFEEHKSGLISLLTESDKNLAQRSQRYWSDLDQEVTSFDSRQQIADEVARLTQDEMMSYLKEVRGALDDRRLLVFNRGKFVSVPTNGKAL
jgi:insulysin